MPDIKPEPTPEMSDNDLADTQQPSPDGVSSTADEAPRKKSGLGPWLFLLFIFIALPAAWIYSPPQLRQQAQQLIADWLPQAQHSSAPVHTVAVQPFPQTTDVATGESTSEPNQTAAPTTATTTEPTQASDTGADSANPAPAAEEPASMAAAPIEAPTGTAEAAPADLPTEQATALLDEMHRLQDELATVQAGQQALQQQLQARQKLELRMRLRWLSRPETRLEQYAALWNDIAVLPNIDETQRHLAEQMATLAQDDLVHIEAWRKALMHLAEQLPEKQQADILPKTENRYLAWLLDAFHLRPAAGESDRQRANLRRQVLDMAQALNNENWPEPSDWRHLLGALHDQFGDKTELGLPESLKAVQQHIADMRAKAAGWLGSL